MTGRPPKRSPERETAILNALRVGNTRRAACAAAEVSVDSLARWMSSDADFRGAIAKAEADAELRFLGQVAMAATTTWQAAAWWLERRHHEHYARHDAVDVRIDVKAEVRKLAEELGLDEAAALAEVENILGAR